MKNWFTTLILTTLLATPVVAQQTPLQQAQKIQAEVNALVSSLTPPAPPTQVVVGPALTLQAAVNSATPGSTVCVPDGTYTTGVVTLPVVPGASSAAPVTLTTCSPVAPGLASTSPVTIQPSPTDTFTIHFAKGAGFWNIVGLRFTAANSSATIASAGDGTETTLADLPHDITFDRDVFDGGWAAKRGVALNGINIALTNSTVVGIMKSGQDTQCVHGFNGPGPFVVANNRLDGGTETIMFGGADPVIPNLVPGNILITGNYVTKNVAQMFVAKGLVKNSFELKNAHDVVVRGNVFENVRIDEQAGWAIQITVRNQGGKCPQCTVSNVEFDHNVVRHAWQAINVLGLDDTKNSVGVVLTSVRASGLNFHDNLFYDIGANPLLGGGTSVTLTVNNGPASLSFVHNTVLPGASVAVALTPGVSAVQPATLLVESNILPEGNYGITDTSGKNAAGVSAWTALADPASIFDFNMMEKTQTTRKITYPGTHNLVGTVTLDTNLVPTVIMDGHDGVPVGADITKIKALIPALDLTK